MSHDDDARATVTDIFDARSSTGEAAVERAARFGAAGLVGRALARSLTAMTQHSAALTYPLRARSVQRPSAHRHCSGQSASMDHSSTPDTQRRHRQRDESAGSPRRMTSVAHRPVRYTGLGKMRSSAASAGDARAGLFHARRETCGTGTVAGDIRLIGDDLLERGAAVRFSSDWRPPDSCMACSRCWPCWLFNPRRRGRGCQTGAVRTLRSLTARRRLARVRRAGSTKSFHGSRAMHESAVVGSCLRWWKASK